MRVRRTSIALLKFMGKAVLNAAGAGILGEFVVDVIPEAATDAWAWWTKDRRAEERRAEIETIVNASLDEQAEMIADTVAEIAGDQTPEIQAGLSRYLSQVPATIQRSLRRPEDPTGKSITADLVPGSVQDFQLYFPTASARFRAGDRPEGVGDWELVELLGRGGGGEVWKARNPRRPKLPHVALKFCLLADGKTRSLLDNEVGLLDRLDGIHPGIIKLQHTFLSAPIPCLEYELVEGGDLAERIRHWHRTGTGPEPNKVARWIHTLAATIGAAHRLDPPVVHRDLKPANVLVMIRPDGKLVLKVADFGLGGIAARRSIEKSRMGISQGQFLVSALMGSHTPLYASPQQIKGEPPDPRDDVHALGIIWYQMISRDLTSGAPTSLEDWDALVEQGLPESHRKLLSTCLARDPARRPRDAAELAERLTALLEPPAPIEPVVSTRPAPAPIAPTPPPQPWRPEPFSEIVSSACGARLKLIPAGSFWMGAGGGDPGGSDEKPEREVHLTQPFYLGVFPVTQDEYAKVMGLKPSYFKPGVGKVRSKDTGRHPVEQVSWLDAVTMCNELSKKEGLSLAYQVSGSDVTILEGANGYRLPTEAEWEYACRAGTTTPWFCGASESSLKEYAWYGSGDAESGTFPVGEKKPNPWGLHDMAGNVWEWCWDWYQDSYQQLLNNNPTGPTTGNHRVLRGGSFYFVARFLRSALRDRVDPSYRSRNYGFRLSRTYS